MRLYGHLCGWLASLTLVIALCSLLVIVVSLAAQVFFRYVLNAPLLHTDEIAQVSLTWLTFTGAAYLYRIRGHIEVDILTRRFPARTAIAIAMCMELVVIGSLAILGLQLLETRATMSNVIYGTLPTSKFMLHSLPLLACVACSILFATEKFLTNWRQLSASNP